jgi:hypothetical protein
MQHGCPSCSNREGYSRSLSYAPTGRIQQVPHSRSNREDTAGLSLLLQQGGYSRAIPPTPTGRIQQGYPSYSNREDTPRLSLLFQLPTWSVQQGLPFLLQHGGQDTAGCTRKAIQQGFPSCYNREDTASSNRENAAGLPPLLIQQGGYT